MASALYLFKGLQSTNPTVNEQLYVSQNLLE